MIEEPTQQYKPDPDFPWKQDDANAPNDNKYEKMSLLNYKNCHFNLILKETHPLANLGINPSKENINMAHKHELNEIKENSQKKNPEVWMFPCSKCKITFESRKLMMNHMKIKHMKEYVTIIENKL